MSQFGDVMVFVPQAVEGDPAEAFITDLWRKQRPHSEAPAKEMGCDVMLAQNPDSCYDLKQNLFRVQLLLVLTTAGGLSFSCYNTNAICVKIGLVGVFRTKTFWGGRARQEA